MACADRICKLCESPFAGTRDWQRYCSIKCRTIAAGRRYKTKYKVKLKKYYRKYYTVPKNRKRKIEIARRHYWNNREKRLLASKERRRSARIEVINKYGGRCVCCGEDAFEFLAIDHVNGDGRNERNLMGLRKYYTMLRRKKLFKKYRILCHNCNSAYGFYGYCPHKKEAA